jgi:CDP-diacylglycerol---serine O-phosphatidyltransferase
VLLRYQNKAYIFIPNVITFCSFLCGIYSLYLIVINKPVVAAYIILFILVLDYADGKIANMLNAETLFGLYFDSLSDLFCFGIVPVFLISKVFFRDLNPIFILILIFYLACCLFRLNRHAKRIIKEKKRVSYFDGLPTTIAGGAIAWFMLLYLTYQNRALFLHLFQCFLVILSILMISSIKFPRIEVMIGSKK